MTYLPPGNQDPYGQQPQPPQDPFSGQQSNPYAQPSPPGPTPSSGPPTAQYGQPVSGYGQPVSGYGQPYGYGVPVAPPQNSMALTSMILSLVGIVTGITAPIGAILGHVAMKQIRQTGESGEGMAKTGIIVGWIVTGFWALCCAGYIVIAVIGITSAANSGY
jgi:Domain of unknown function (DUF4190)